MFRRPSGSAKRAHRAKTTSSRRLFGRKPVIELLEDRRVLASFAEAGEVLSLTLDQTNESVAIVSNGATYSLALTGGTWSGTDSANVTGNGTPNLTVTSDGLAAFTDINIADENASNTSVTFNDSSTNNYSETFNILLDHSNAGAITFNGASRFTGTAALIATTNGSILFNSGSAVSVVDGDFILSASPSLNQPGIALDDAHLFATGEGGISLVGRGGISANGVDLFESVVESTTGTGSITIQGTAATEGTNGGVRITASEVKSSTGNIEITGDGRGADSGDSDHGVVINSASKIVSTGTATITIQGTGGNASGGANVGVVIVGNNTEITSVSGSIQITGQGGTADGDANRGVLLEDNATISSTGIATIAINGTGGGTGANSDLNDGVAMNGAVRSVDGNIAVVGTAGVGNSVAFNLVSGIETTGDADVLLVGNSITISGTNAIAASTNTVTLQAGTGTTAIDLGSKTAGKLGITDAELDRIAAAVLLIGQEDGAAISVTAPITRSVATTFSLRSNAGISFLDPGTIDANGGTLNLGPNGTAPITAKTIGFEATAATTNLLSPLVLTIAGTIANATYDQFSVDGVLSLGGVNLQLSGPFIPVPGNVFTIVSATGGVTGVFAGLNDGDTFLFNGVPLQIDYTGTSVTLTAIAPPRATLDAQGQLVLNGTANADTVTLSVVGDSLIVNDPAGGLSTNIPGATVSPNGQQLTVPLSAITGGKVIFSGLAGDDELRVAASLIAAGLDVDFEGGVDDDKLTILEGTFHTSVFTYVSASDGSVAFKNEGGTTLNTISYTGLEPVTSDIQSDVVELIYTGADETITVTDDGGGQTRVVSTLGEVTTFDNPTVRLEISATNGTDTINVNSLANNYANLTITGDSATDIVNLDGPITFAATRGLNVSGVGTANILDSISGTTGNISISAGAVNQSDDISTTTGTVTVVATAGSIEMDEGDSTSTTTGTINYSANVSVLLSLLSSASGDINVTANTGAIVDATASETANLITTATATLSAATGIGGPSGDDDINTTIATLVATNSTSGDIAVQETNNLTIGGDGVRTLGADGNIDIDVAAGNLDIDSVVTAHGSGGIDIELNNLLSTININATVSSTSGNITVAAGAINQNSNVATGGIGNVVVAANASDITMADGVSTTTANGSITYSAAIDIALGLLTSTTGNLIVTADANDDTNGAILDNTAAETPNLVTGGGAILSAADGIGGAAASDLDTQVARLQATNDDTGNIVVTDVGALELADLGGGYAIQAVAAAFITATSPLTISDNVTVNANSVFTATDSAAIGDDLTIQDDVIINGNGNLLTFRAGDNFLFAAGATIINPLANVIVAGDFGDADTGVGTDIQWLGTITANNLTINGEDDNDTFTVNPSVNTPITVNGDDPPPARPDAPIPPGDRLIVPLAGIGDVNLATAALPDGSITFTAASHRTITYTSIETLLAVPSDEFETPIPNNSIATATIVGSPVVETFRNLTISPSGDLDFFKYTAHFTGKLIVRIHFDHSIGNLALEIQDASGDVVASANNSTDDLDFEEIILPVVAQQNYFIRVSGVDGAINFYALEIENFVAPIPSFVDLIAASDLGRQINDNITSDSTPEFRIQADLVDFRDSGIELLNQAVIDPNGDGNASDSTADGAGVFVTLVNLDTGNVVSGFANQVGTGGFLWSFIVPDLASLGDGEYFVSAAVQIVDGKTPLATGRTQLSTPLTILVDTTDPAVNFGVAANANDGLDPSSDTGVQGQPDTVVDRITSDSTPTFWGTAEANATIRVYVRDAAGARILIGETVATPFNGNNPNQVGRWSLTSTIDMNDPLLGFVDGGGNPLLDGVRQLEVEAEDIAGNVQETPDTLNIFIDTQGPQIINVTGPGGADLFDKSAPSPIVDSITIDFVDFPERTNEFLYPAVNQILASTPGNYRLVGNRVGAIPIASVTFVDSTTAGGIALTQVTLNFANPLPDDVYTLTVFDRIRDDAGNQLDGEFLGFINNEFFSGDFAPGGDFVISFDIDALPELGVWSAGTVLIDLNGNFIMNGGFAGGDLAFDLGFSSDYVFAGNFAPIGGVADGFDKIAAYGRVGNTWRWLIDTNNDGVPDIIKNDPLAINGIPVAGNFDGNAANGDEVGVFTGTAWWFDTNHDYLLDTRLPASGTTNYRGFPIAGDYDGDGDDDVATYVATSNLFYIDLNTAAPNTKIQIDGIADYSFSVGVPPAGGAPGFYGFAGVRERPVSADMNGDGVDDIGLWAPDGAALTPSDVGEWFFFLSNNNPATAAVENSIINRIQGGPLNGFISFRPAPFGNDLYAQFGNSFALPVVGNFDPPGSGPTQQIAATSTPRPTTRPTPVTSVSQPAATSQTPVTSSTAISSEVTTPVATNTTAPTVSATTPQPVAPAAPVVTPPTASPTSPTTNSQANLAATAPTVPAMVTPTAAATAAAQKLAQLKASATTSSASPATPTTTAALPAVNASTTPVVPPAAPPASTPATPVAPPVAAKTSPTNTSTATSSIVAAKALALAKLKAAELAPSSEPPKTPEVELLPIEVKSEPAVVVQAESLVSAIEPALPSTVAVEIVIAPTAASHTPSAEIGSSIAPSESMASTVTVEEPVGPALQTSAEPSVSVVEVVTIPDIIPTTSPNATTANVSAGSENVLVEATAVEVASIEIVELPPVVEMATEVLPAEPAIVEVVAAEVSAEVSEAATSVVDVPKVVVDTPTAAAPEISPELVLVVDTPTAIEVMCIPALAVEPAAIAAVPEVVAQPVVVEPVAIAAVQEIAAQPVVESVAAAAPVTTTIEVATVAAKPVKATPATPKVTAAKFTPAIADEAISTLTVSRPKATVPAPSLAAIAASLYNSGGTSSQKAAATKAKLAQEKAWALLSRS